MVRFLSLEVPYSKLLFIAILFSIAISELIVCSMDLLLNYQITFDYVLTGFITPIIVSIIITPTFIHFIQLQKEDALKFQHLAETIQQQSEILMQNHRQLALQKLALDKSESQLKALFNNMDSGILIFSYDNQYRTFVCKASNLKAQQIENLSVNELVNRSLEDIFSYINTADLIKTFIQVLKTNASQSLTWSFSKKSELNWYEYHIFALPNQEIVLIYNDISERKRIELSLQKSETRFRAIIEASPIPYALNDKDLNIVFLNSAFTKIFGYDIVDIPSVYEWWPKAYPDANYRQWVIDSWMQRLNFHKQHPEQFFEPLEVNVHCKNGEIKTVLCSTADLPESLNDIHLVVLYDVSELKLAEKQRLQFIEQLEAKEKQNRLILDCAGEGIYGINLQGNILFINQAACDMLGYQVEELLHVSIHQKIHHSYPNGLPYPIENCPTYQAMQLGINYNVRNELLWRKDGSNFFTDFTSAPLINNESIVGAVVVFKDISERKIAETALIESENRFRELFTHIPIAYQSLDQEGRYLDVNEFLCQLLGYSREYLLGKCFSEFWPPSNRSLFSQKLKNFILKGEVCSELELLTAQNEIITVIVEGRIQRDLKGDFLRTHCVLVNISERKQFENALNKSNADLEQFAYSVSHDMRQPLRAISSHLQILQKTLLNQLIDDDRETLLFALEGAKRMDAMIVSLLDYSRVGRKTQMKMWINSRLSLNNALDFLKIQLESLAISVNIKGEWPQIFASHEELTRLFLNLLSNAIKYREANNFSAIDIHSMITPTYWQVSIQDYGIGIHPNQMDRLFQFFSRLQPRSRFEGTGMGLALCRRIVQNHQGKIWVESAGEGLGSCFHFQLALTKLIEN
ncbi:MAG: hypothetical protein RL637_269 [Pseudomonadota bacterium]